MENQIECPVCGKSNFHVVKKYRELSLGFCKNCTLAYARPLVKGQADDVGRVNASITNSDYYKQIEKDFELQSAMAIKKVPLLVEYWTSILKKKPKSVLEIGCGTGQYYNAFQKAGIAWQGVEVNKSMLEFCRSRNMPVVEFHEIIQTNNTYDAVFMSQVLEHNLEPKSFLHSVKKRMDSHGLLHLDVPNQDSITSLYRRINRLHPEYGFVQPMHHLIAYNRNSLTHLVKQCGFEIIHLDAHTEEEPVFGQLMVNPPLIQKLAFVVSRMFNRGSLLVCVAVKTD